MVDKIRERQAAAVPVTIAQTCEHQEAIASDNTTGKRFFATGGGTHITTDDGFIAAEMNRRNKVVAEREKEKKSWFERHARRDTALNVLDRLKYELGGGISGLSGAELTVLLRWKGILVTKMGTVANKRALYQKIVDVGGGEQEDEATVPAR
jgi:hypothetical protein